VITRRVIAGFVSRPPASALGSFADLDELTSEELGVLEHIARGLSNAEIAAETALEEAAVAEHASRILEKLRLRDRVQAVVYAYEHGIVHAGETVDGTL